MALKDVVASSKFSDYPYKLYNNKNYMIDSTLKIFCSLVLCR